MADNLGVNQTSYSSPEEGIDFPTQAKQMVEDIIKQGAVEEYVQNCQVYLVLFSFTLGSWKALISTNMPDGRYYEVTHNKAKSETYVDVYQKIRQHVISHV